MEKIYGLRPIIEAIKSGKNIEKIYFKENLKGKLFSELFKLTRQKGISYQFVNEKWFNKFKQHNHQGVIALISIIEYVEVQEIIDRSFEQGKNPLFIILDKVTDVGNFGAIARTAECAAADLIIIGNKNSAQINETAIKTSAGALLKIPVAKVKSLVNTIKQLKDNGFQIIAATEKGDKFYFEVDYNKPTAIILGSEGEGISKAVLRLADIQAQIPILGTIESLNVSVAAALFIYEKVRQKLNK